VNVDTGDLTEVVRQVAALNGRVTALTGRVTTLTRHLESVATAEAIIRRANFGYPAPGGPGHPGPPPPRPRHLHPIEGGPR
jgi:hypothetical protein